MVAQFSGKRWIDGGTAGIQHYLWAASSSRHRDRFHDFISGKMTYVSCHYVRLLVYTLEEAACLAS